MRAHAWMALLLAVPVALAPLAEAQSDSARFEPRQAASVHVTALAVAQTPSGLEGVVASVQATALVPGTGQVFVSTKPLAATDMQASARLAARVAAQSLAMDAQAYDYLVEFRSESAVIGGPSAGAVMTMALAAALHNVAHPDQPWRLDATVAATGTINPDGTIGPVGGIPEKAAAAARAGITLFLYPAGMDVATRLEPAGLGFRTVGVEMASHCRSLGIACRSVATVEDVLAAAAGVRLQRPEAPVPSTLDYDAQLGPSVEAQVEALRQRTQAARPEAAPSDQARVADEWAQAEDRLVLAAEALGDGRYYLAATHSFQGHIFASRAEWLGRFSASGYDEEVVADALASCRDAFARAQAASQGAAARGANGLQAVAAAQQRLLGTQALLEQAQASYQQARWQRDWVASMESSAFCVERAATVAWWLGMADAFGPGPEVGDATAMALQELDLAREMVAYAQGVAGPGGAGAARMQEAEALLDQGYAPGAWAAAIDAQSVAAVQVQTAGGVAVSADVLAAAQAGASRAILAARQAGAEPILPVSLVELSAVRDERASALGDLWSARSMALAGPAVAAAPHEESVPHGGQAGASGAAIVLWSVVVGAVAGGSAVAFMWALQAPRRR